MYTTDTRSRFIELRGRGLSYDKISRHLGVAKSTLVAWNRLYAPAIQELYDRQLHTASNHVANETYWHPMHAPRTSRRKPRKPGILKRFGDLRRLFPLLGERVRVRANSLRTECLNKSWLRLCSAGFSAVKICARRFLRSPFVRSLIRWAAFKP